MSSIGHNSGMREDDAQRRHDLNIIAISTWVGKRRVDEALGRKQLGDLSGLDRLVTLRNATLDNMRQFYVTNPGADVAPGALTLICLMSDNSDGCCSVSVSRMAQFLNRDRRNVGKALARLEADGCIRVERREGKNPLVWPVINPVYAEHRDPITWVLDAHAPTDRHIAPAIQPPQVKAPAIQPSQVVKFPAKSKAEHGTCDTAIAGSEGDDLRYSHPGPAIQPSHYTAIDTAKGKIDSEGGAGGDAASSPSARPKEIAPQEDIEGAKAKPARKPRANKIRFDSLPSGYWLVSDREYAERQGLTADEARKEFENFRDHHKAKGTVHVDWRAAWQLWCRRSVEYRANSKRPTGSKFGGPQSVSDQQRALDALTAGLDTP